MKIRERIEEDVKAAMRSHANKRRDTLRSLLAAVKQEEVDSQQSAGDEMVLSVLKKQAKQRFETIADAERAGREQLALEAKEELAIIEEYLPQMMSREQIQEEAEQVIAELGASGMGSMGQVMGVLMPRLGNEADGRVVSDVVRQLLR